jgi:hypothetical protein
VAAATRTPANTIAALLGYGCWHAACNDFSMDTIDANLRYIEAENLRIRSMAPTGSVLKGRRGNVLGKLSGILVDPLRRQVRYLIVESRSWLATRHYSVPLDATRVDREHKALVVDLEADALSEVQVGSIPKFSDDDLIAALFSPLAA